MGWEGGAGDALRFETHGRGLGARGLSVSLEGRDELQRYYLRTGVNTVTKRIIIFIDTHRGFS